MTVSWTDDLGVSDDPDRFKEAIEAFRRKVPMSDDEFDELTAEEKLRAFKVANVAQADLVQDVFDALDSAIETGSTLEDFQTEVGAQLAEAWGGENASQLETVFRTNVLGAYNQGRHEIFSTPEAKEARPYWRFDAIEDDRIDDECAECDGIVLPADDPWWSTHIPPLHFNCRCSYVALSDEEAREEGLTDEPPAAEADDGFGAAPATDDWEPDSSRFDEAIAAELDRKLAG